MQFQMEDKIITTLENITKIVSMIEQNGIVFVATEYQVFKVVNDQLIPLEIKYENSDE